MTIHVWLNGEALEVHGPVKGMIDWLIKHQATVNEMGKGHVTLNFTPKSVVAEIRKVFEAEAIED